MMGVAETVLIVGILFGVLIILLAIFYPED